MTRKRVVALLVVAATGALCSPVPLSLAASTRAEYVAEVDPRCAENLPSWTSTNKTVLKTYKQWVRLLKRGTLKAWVRQTHKHARALRAHVEVHESLTSQVSLVPAPVQDAQLVANWLAYRNEWERLTWLGAKAFDAFKFRRWDKLITRANRVGLKEWDTAFLIGLSGACR